jgi:hypothetical protein
VWPSELQSVRPLIFHALMTPVPNRRINRWPASDGGSSPGDDGGSHSLSWIGIDNSASGLLGPFGRGDSGAGGDGGSD